MPLKLNEQYRCDWVRENNGTVQVMLMPVGRTKDAYPLISNSPKESGVPKVGEIYFVSILPAFPH